MEKRTLDHTTGSRSILYKILFAILPTLLPLIITRKHWLALVKGSRPRAWDGTGHFALAQLYSENIFPDTFGWIDGYFSGMPFPNFYPPLFYWLVGLLANSGIFSLLTAFKLVVSAPVVLMPFLVWVLVYRNFGRNLLAASFSAIALVWLLLDYRFTGTPPPGLDYFSTFQVGMYTQPLGFALFLIWLDTYLNFQNRLITIFLSSSFLGLVILANFFAAMTAALFVVCGASYYVYLFFIQKHKKTKSKLRKVAIAKILIPLISVGLAAFWLVPMATQSDFFVTRPTIAPIFTNLNSILIIWCVLALAGFLLWLRKPSLFKNIYTGGCALLLIILLSSVLIPAWFPYQSNRFMTMLNFLLSIPVGTGLAQVVYYLMKKFGKLGKVIFGAPNSFEFGVLIILLLVTYVAVKPVNYELAFFPEENDKRLKGIFEFAAQNRDGRYLTEIPSPQYPVAQLDGRAINSYLGSQGNDVASVVFREASPNSLFYNPMANKFSAHTDSYGISSILADDRDFLEQPYAIGLEQAQFLGVKYLVVISPWIKDKLRKELSVKEDYEFGGWSIFEINQEKVNKSFVELLTFKPFLVLSSYTFKQRKSDDLSFVRLAEEQFFAGDFDFTLVRSEMNQIDELTQLTNFSGLIIEQYNYQDEEKAFEILSEHAKQYPIILISSDSKLFNRLRSNQSQLPNLKIVERPVEVENHTVESEQPALSYNQTRIRQMWKEISDICRQGKIPANYNYKVDYEQSKNKIVPPGSTNGQIIPVLIKKSFHPNWETKKGSKPYWAAPFYQLLFISGEEETVLAYHRKNTEIVSLIFSGIIFLSLLITLCYQTKKPAGLQNSVKHKK